MGDQPGEKHEEPGEHERPDRENRRRSGLPATQVGNRLVERRNRAVGAQREPPRPEKVGLQMGGEPHGDRSRRDDERPARAPLVEERADEAEHDDRHEVEEVAVDHERPDRQVPGGDDRQRHQHRRRSHAGERARPALRRGPHDAGEQPGRADDEWEDPHPERKVRGVACRRAGCRGGRDRGRGLAAVEAEVAEAAHRHAVDESREEERHVEADERQVVADGPLERCFGAGLPGAFSRRSEVGRDHGERKDSGEQGELRSREEGERDHDQGD